MVITQDRHIPLPENVPISPIIKNLPKSITIDSNIFEMFSISFRKLYQQYIERGRAPFEINISSQNIENMEQHYNNICLQSQPLTEQTFWKFWFDLTIVCLDVIENLHSLLARYN